jgi:hypothetical protein
LSDERSDLQVGLVYLAQRPEKGNDVVELISKGKNENYTGNEKTI